MMDLHLLNLAILVLEAPFYVFYGTSHQVYCKFDTDIIVFLITLIWYLIQTNTHIWHQKGLGGVKTSDNLFLEHFPYFTIPSLLFFFIKREGGQGGGGGFQLWFKIMHLVQSGPLMKQRDQRDYNQLILSGII